MSDLVLKPNGQPFDSILLFQDYMWLPVETPFGNMQTKIMKVEQRIGHANLRLKECYGHWDEFRSMTVPGIVDHGALHWLTGEEAVFLLRRAADELVSLTWFLTERLHGGEYPRKIMVDSISKALDSKPPLFENHRWLLETLNAISNAHKHSFIQSDPNIVGVLEPCVYSLALTWNNLTAGEKFQNVALGDLARAFTVFVAEVLGDLRELSKELNSMPE